MWGHHPLLGALHGCSLHIAQALTTHARPLSSPHFRLWRHTQASSSYFVAPTFCARPLSKQTSSSICLDFDILHLLDHPPSVNIPLHLLGIQHHRLSHSPAETASSCCFGVATLLALTFSVDTYISQPTWCLFDWTAKERDGKEVEENIVCFVFNVFLNLQFNDFW